MLAMQQSAAENAEIAGQWKERADSFETQLGAAKEAAAATERSWRSRLGELEERLEAAQAERRRAEGAASRAGSPRSVGTGGGMPGSPVAMPSSPSAGLRGAPALAPAAGTPSGAPSHSDLLARTAQQEAKRVPLLEAKLQARPHARRAGPPRSGARGAPARPDAPAPEIIRGG